MNFKLNKINILNNTKERNYRIITFLAILLFVLTVLGTTHNYRFAMMGLVTFVLAYLTKGMRRRSSGS